MFLIALSHNRYRLFGSSGQEVSHSLVVPRFGLCDTLPESKCDGLLQLGYGLKGPSAQYLMLHPAKDGFERH